jgi:hypothetical protein
MLRPLLMWLLVSPAALAAASHEPDTAATGSRPEAESTPHVEAIAFEGGRFVIAAAGGGCVVALQGTITKDADWKFEEVLRKSSASGCAEPWLMLESPGGGLLDGINLGRQVRARGLRTITRYDCASACAIIFLGGIERVLAGSRARIGLHQPATVRDFGIDRRRCAMSPDSQMAQGIRQYLRWVVPQTAEEVLQVMMTTSCNSIAWEQGARAVELGIATRLESEKTDLFGPRSKRR